MNEDKELSIEELEGLQYAATGDRWLVHKELHGELRIGTPFINNTGAKGDFSLTICRIPIRDIEPADAKLIAIAPTAVRQLIAARKEIAELKAAKSNYNAKRKNWCLCSVGYGGAGRHNNHCTAYYRPNHPDLIEPIDPNPPEGCAP